MTHDQPIHLGFLTVLPWEDQGHVGGYLILNQSGRPIEFHCTAPVKASRAQQILFGPTLEPYLYGEQIAQTLLAKGSAKPAAVFTDVAPVLTVRDFVDTPTTLVIDERTTEQSNTVGLTRFKLAHNDLAVANRHKTDATTILSVLGAVDLFDLAEPFSRVREAIEETRRPSRAA